MCADTENRKPEGRGLTLKKASVRISRRAKAGTEIELPRDCEPFDVVVSATILRPSKCSRQVLNVLYPAVPLAVHVVYARICPRHDWPVPAILSVAGELIVRFLIDTPIVIPVSAKVLSYTSFSLDKAVVPGDTVELHYIAQGQRIRVR